MEIGETIIIEGEDKEYYKLYLDGRAWFERCCKERMYVVGLAQGCVNHHTASGTPAYCYDACLGGSVYVCGKCGEIRDCGSDPFDPRHWQAANFAHGILKLGLTALEVLERLKENKFSSKVIRERMIEKESEYKEYATQEEIIERQKRIDEAKKIIESFTEEISGMGLLLHSYEDKEDEWTGYVVSRGKKGFLGRKIRYIEIQLTKTVYGTFRGGTRGLHVPKRLIGMRIVQPGMPDKEIRDLFWRIKGKIREYDDGKDERGFSSEEEIEFLYGE